MSRPCSICTHKKRSQIEAAMLGPASIRVLAARFQLSYSAVQRHKAGCLRTEAIAKQVEQEAARATSLADTWLGLKQRLERLANDAMRDKDRKGEISAIREQTRLVDLGIRAASELRKNEGAGAPLHEHKDWPALTGALVIALAPYPDAQVAVCSALDSIAAQGGV